MATAKNTSLLLVLLFLFSELSLAAPPGAADAPQEPLNCSSKFSGDYYGLGVRLGIYFIWLTSWVANTFIEEEISGALDANAIFLFALLVSIFKGTAVSGKEKLAYIDGLVLMQLCAGYLFGVFSLWGYRTTHYRKEGPKAIRHYGRIGTHCRLALVTAISVYGVWFWTYGIRYDRRQGLARVTDDQGVPRPPECYPVYIFFFAKLNVLGGIRVFYMISSISTSLYYGGMLLAAIAERIRHLIRVMTKEKGHHTRHTFNYQTGLTKKELNFLYNLNCVFNFVWIVFSATTVELTLVWNHTTEVLGPNGKISYPAQLLPMVIGALSLFRILWILFQRWQNRAEDSCDVNPETQQKVGASPGAPTDNPRSGLGLLPYSRATNAVIDGEDYDESVVHNRTLILRYAVAYSPWLSQFEIWKNPGGHRRAPSSTAEEGGGSGINNYHDSPMMTMRTSYKCNDDTDLPYENMPSSNVTSPMLDMKSPTSVNTSPAMDSKRYG